MSTESTTPATGATKLVDFCHRVFRLGVDLDLRHARWLRGAIARLCKRPEFHHHHGQGTLYAHPLIRYDTSSGEAVAAGMSDGAYLVKAIPTINRLRLGDVEYDVIGTEEHSERVRIGPTRDLLTYRFVSPYLALNQANHLHWKASAHEEREELLKRVVIGNILSLSKAVRLTVTERIIVETDLKQAGFFTLKPGVELCGFQGTFAANFCLPAGWGLGKSSARGFGTLDIEE